MEKNILENIASARRTLLMRFPFYGHLLMGMPIALATCGTACTDGDRLIFDPAFTEALSPEELQVVLLHEVMHCVLGHCTRGRTLNPSMFNVACDTVVNSMILQELGKSSFTVRGSPLFHRAPDGTEGFTHSAEEVYHMLLDNANGKKQRAYRSVVDGYKPFDRHDTWRVITDTEQMDAIWEHRLEEAYKSAGTYPKHLPQMREFKYIDNYQSKVDWRKTLLDFLKEDDFDYSFQPPDTRYEACGFLLPAFNQEGTREEASDLWLLVDTSASVDEKELSIMLQEIRAALDQVGMSGKLSFFDDTVYEPVAFSTIKDLNEIRPVGDGGTSFVNIFRYMKQHMSEHLPRAVLIFTDGHARSPSESAAMDVPVLWLSTEGGDTCKPWGEVISL